MATMTKKKPVGKFLIYGILSFILYYILLAKQDLITE
jgi:hypothetical protein